MGKYFVIFYFVRLSGNRSCHKRLEKNNLFVLSNWLMRYDVLSAEQLRSNCPPPYRIITMSPRMYT